MKDYITYILQQNSSYRFTTKGEIFAPIDGDLWQNILSPDQHQTFEENELFDLSSINTLNDWELTGAKLGNQWVSSGKQLAKNWSETGTSLGRNWRTNERILVINKYDHRVQLKADQLPDGHSKEVLRSIEEMFKRSLNTKKTETLEQSLKDLKLAQQAAFADDVNELSYYRNVFTNRLIRQRDMKQKNYRLQKEKEERRQAKVYLIAAAIVVLLLGVSFTFIKFELTTKEESYSTQVITEEIETTKTLTLSDKKELIKEFELSESVEVYKWRYDRIMEALEDVNEIEQCKKTIRDEYFKKY